MEKVWDNSLSALINSNPQAFLDLLLPGAACLLLVAEYIGGWHVC